MIHQCSICNRIHDCGELPDECDSPMIITMNCRDYKTWEPLHEKKYLVYLNSLAEDSFIEKMIKFILKRIRRYV